MPGQAKMMTFLFNGGQRIIAHVSLMHGLLFFLLGVSVLATDARSQQSAQGRYGMVVSADSTASAAGLEILQRGGNAIDAAVAVGFTLAVTYPEAGNLGGGGFMVIRFADGRSTMIDFRETAPSLAVRDMFLDAHGDVDAQKTTIGPLAAGVPGTVAGLLLASKKYGLRSYEQLLERAITCARDGFVIDHRLALALSASSGEFALFPSTVKYFNPELAQGTILKQPDLARVLERIQRDGRWGFYRGETARAIVEQMKKGGGIMTLSDLQLYEAKEREVLRGSYRGHEIISAAPPSSGGFLVIQILQMLERFDLRAKGRTSVTASHLIASAFQRAFADRATYIGDPDVVDVPVSWLISPEYCRERSFTIDSLRFESSSFIGPGEAPDNHETTHYVVADNFGNVVSVTTTLNGAFGCKTVVDGAGFFLNNEMDDFVIAAGTANQFGLSGGDANMLKGNKRMVSSMSPTIVVKDDKPFLVLGARGGSRIPTSVTQVILNVVDFSMSLEEAVSAPRIHHQWFPDLLLYEEGGVDQHALKAMGYDVTDFWETKGKVQALMFDAGNETIIGMPDPREGGKALGW